MCKTGWLAQKLKLKIKPNFSCGKIKRVFFKFSNIVGRSCIHLFLLYFVFFYLSAFLLFFSSAPIFVVCRITGIVVGVLQKWLLKQSAPLVRQNLVGTPKIFIEASNRLVVGRRCWCWLCWWCRYGRIQTTMIICIALYGSTYHLKEGQVN